MDDDDADNMESSFSQQMREEFHSKKMGNVYFYSNYTNMFTIINYYFYYYNL